MSEIKIKSTTEYNKFKMFANNRNLNESLVCKLMDSIKQIGFITGRPVLVDNHFNIIDGQHRFEACKRLGLPIYYEITKGDTHEIMIQLNAKQVSWKIQDYIHSWANQGVKCYQKLVKFEDTHKLGISNAILAFFDGDDSSKVLQSIKEGKTLKINPNAEDIALFINSCELVPYAKTSYFVKALTKVFRKADNKQLEKIKKYLISLPQQASVSAYVVAFENLVNKGVMSKNKISFVNN